MNPFAHIPLSQPVLSQVPLAGRTTWRIGGLAQWLIAPVSVDELSLLLQQWPESIPRFLLGGGSNLLIADNGFQGAVLDLTSALKKIYTLAREDTEVIIHAEAGASTSRLAHFARLQGVGGAEFLGGIPGSIGGALRMNAGAYGGEIKNILKNVSLMDPYGATHQWSVEQLGMQYRTTVIPNDWIFTSARFRLRPDDPEKIRLTMRQFNQRRRRSQPLELPSAGSVFKNPPNAPKAWELIDQAGLRGATQGDAQVSTKHSNFFVNRGHAQANEMLHLIQRVVAQVEKRSAIHL